MADMAMEFLRLSGFKAERTRENLFGYPELFRELNKPPPWSGVTLEDVNRPIVEGPSGELRALYLHANETPLTELLNRFAEHEEQRAARLGIELPPQYTRLGVELFEDKLVLARCLGTEDFEHLYEAVFDCEKLTRAVGAPDLFVWDPEAGIWFFAEVKGPHDRLQGSHADWVRAHWEPIKGRFVLLVVPSDA